MHQKPSQEIFSLKSTFVEFWNCGLQTCKINKDGTENSKVFLKLFEILEYPFFPDHFL